MTNFSEVQCNEFGRKVYRDLALTLNCYMLLDVMLRIGKKKVLLTSNKLNVCLVELNTQVFKAASNLASNILKKVYLRQYLNKKATLILIELLNNFLSNMGINVKE